MNGVREEYSIKVKQTSKGIWYCDGLQVISETTTGLATELNHIMTQVEGVLYEHNEPEPGDNPMGWSQTVSSIPKTKEKKPVDAGGEK